MPCHSRLARHAVLASGAALAFVGAGHAQCELDKLHLSGAQPGDLFGSDVSLWGDRALIGALSHDGAGGTMIGAVSVWERASVGWQQVALLTAADPHVNGFGASLALDGDVALLGAPSDDTMGNDVGSAYVFERSGDAWVQVAKLLPPPGIPVAHAGRAVALSGTTAFVGAPHNEGPLGLPGTVFVYDRGPGGWSLSQVMPSPEPAVAGRFGGALAMQGARAAIGAKGGSGAAGVKSGTTWVAERAGPGPGGWTLVAQLSPSDGQPGDDFGVAVALDGDTVLVGSDEDDDLGADAGAAYVYDRDPASGAWSQTARLLAEGGQPGDFAGRDVGLAGSRALLSIDRGVQPDFPGAVCLFERSGAPPGAWVQLAELHSSDAAPGDAYGRHFAVEGDSLLVGSLLDDDGAADTGSAYLVHLGSAPAWTDLGAALPGAAGPPLLAGSGETCSGGAWLLSLTDGRALAPAALVAGFAALQAPFKGGTLVPAPDVVLAGLGTDGAGALSLSLALPVGVPSGLALLFQVLVADAAAPHGVALSNAVMAQAP
jgi:hypothetical protein